MHAWLLQECLGLLCDLHRGRLLLHCSAAVLGGNDVLCHVWAAVLVGDGCQAISYASISQPLIRSVFVMSFGLTAQLVQVRCNLSHA